MRLPSFLFLFLLAGCTATTTNTSSSSSSGGDPNPGGSSGDPGTPAAPVCTDTTNFETDAKNCGRCGRACDDGTCNAGMCGPRIEATSASMPSSAATEIAVAGGQLFARLSHTPNPQTTRATSPIVRFEDGKLVTVLSDTQNGCASHQIECMVSDGKTLFVETIVGDTTGGAGARVIKRVASDGTVGKDILVPDDGYGFPQMAALDGRVLIRGITGPTALFGQDGKVTRLTELRYAEWPILGGDHVLYSNIHEISRVKVGSGAATLGLVEYSDSGRIDTIAADDRFVYALTANGQLSVPTVNRFPRNGMDARPDKSETLSAEALERLNAASIKVPTATARTVNERSIAHDGRFYFTLLVMPPEGGASQNRVIVEWSIERGFRPVANIPAWQGDSGTRLVVGGTDRTRRLYWIEQGSASTTERSPWRILSIPL